MSVRYAILAYGQQEVVYRQATMAVLSLLAHAPRPRDIVIVTDRPHRFGWLSDRVRLRVLIPGELEQWRGPSPFSMRQKLEAARAVMPGAGALAFLDADTIAVADLTPFVDTLTGGIVLMHKPEFELGASRRTGNRKLWEQLRGRDFEGWQFRADDAMWNSGVLALPVADAGLLDQALTIYDAMAAAGIRHFATEQLVVGLVLGRTGRLRDAQRWFTHYWGNKENFDREIARRLDEANLRQMTPEAAAELLRRNPIDLAAESRPGRIEKLRRWLTKDQPPKDPTNPSL